MCQLLTAIMKNLILQHGAQYHSCGASWAALPGICCESACGVNGWCEFLVWFVCWLCFSYVFFLVVVGIQHSPQMWL